MLSGGTRLTTYRSITGAEDRTRSGRKELYFNRELRHYGVKVQAPSEVKRRSGRTNGSEIMCLESARPE